MAVDTSALMAILMSEPPAVLCLAALEGDAEVLISAGTLAEALIIARRRDVAEEMQQLMDAKTDLRSALAATATE